MSKNSFIAKINIFQTATNYDRNDTLIEKYFFQQNEKSDKRMLKSNSCQNSQKI